MRISDKLWNDLYEAVLGYEGKPFTRKSIAKRMGRAKSPTLLRALNLYEAEGWLVRTYNTKYAIPQIVYRETPDFLFQVSLEEWARTGDEGV